MSSQEWHIPLVLLRVQSRMAQIWLPSFTLGNSQIHFPLVLKAEVRLLRHRCFPLRGKSAIAAVFLDRIPSLPSLLCTPTTPLHHPTSSNLLHCHPLTRRFVHLLTFSIICSVLHYWNQWIYFMSVLIRPCIIRTKYVAFRYASLNIPYCRQVSFISWPHGFGSPQHAPPTPPRSHCLRAINVRQRCACALPTREPCPRRQTLHRCKGPRCWLQQQPFQHPPCILRHPPCILPVYFLWHPCNLDATIQNRHASMCTHTVILCSIHEAIFVS